MGSVLCGILFVQNVVMTRSKHEVDLGPLAIKINKLGRTRSPLKTCHFDWHLEPSR